LGTAALNSCYGQQLVKSIGDRVPNHRSSVDGGIWEAPLVDGAPASTWVILVSVSLTVGFAAAVLAFVLDIVAPQLMNVWAGSPVAVIDAVCFVAGAVLAGFGFPALFRQANRETAAGYTTLNWSSFRGSVPLVNARTRRIEGGAASRFDPAAARAGTPWSSSAGSQPQPPQLSSVPRLAAARARGRWPAIGGIVLFALAIWARVENGSVSGAGTLMIGAVVTGALFVAVLVAVLVNRLSKVSQVASGIIIAGVTVPQVLASSDRLGVPRGVIPRAAVLVFDSEGLSIWQGSGVPRPVVSISRHDVISLETATITSGRTSTIGLEITIIPPDERWPFIMKFTVFDPARILAAADEEEILALITSIIKAWSN
jgi:hypothetical protein